MANESETLRNFMDSRVPETALRELYLLPFEMAVQDAGAWSMMAAYNDVNGVAATEHDHVQNGIVKGEWGWDGLHSQLHGKWHLRFNRRYGYQHH